ncbi:pirin family protein [Actinacidiphila sp. ITFR-21]|uniref:pirin family protein n=1 Tax=Actinacidiphila sp. ITFR-21 TaxID=3075199 RepID=UPI00288C346C|nr:pirin family protein [Streptomyces sp. ITFR-21]WNI19588.1 pirin family protein [Streptomyces sp. ITFR-21]
MEVRRAGDRYRSGEAGTGIETRHAFSFGAHYAPDNVRFGLLLACNEERLAPGAGFAEHPHRDTEIVTWVVTGELAHRDGEGRATRLGPGGLQVLSAGSGVRHEERNAGGTPLRFVQMWLHPGVFGGPPGYAAAPAPAPPGPGLRLLASGAPGTAPALRLRHPAAALHAGRPTAPDSCPLPDAPFLYVHVVRGRVHLGDHLLKPGDAARITDERAVHAATRGPAEYLVWEMHGPFSAAGSPPSASTVDTGFERPETRRRQK